MFSKEFTGVIRICAGNLLLWPVPSLEWIGHTEAVQCVCYSPNWYCIVTGSADKTICVWDAESGTVLGKPLTVRICLQLFQFGIT